jgi:hypothetical protein
VHVDCIKTRVERAYLIKVLTLLNNRLLSSFAFTFNLRCYSEERYSSAAAAAGAGVGLPAGAGAAVAKAAAGTAGAGAPAAEGMLRSYVVTPAPEWFR